MKKQQIPGADHQIGPYPSSAYSTLLQLRSYRRLLKVDDVADLLDKSKFTIYRMAQRHRIPALRVGGSWRFDPSVLELWLVKKYPILAQAAREIAAREQAAQDQSAQDKSKAA
jgi:excisionase family DNA binding protein